MITNKHCELRQEGHREDTDVLRILAAFGVVLIHATGTSTHPGTVYDALARFSVPVFVIISGYYMLSAPIPPGKLAKRCARLFLLLILWSSIQYSIYLLTGEKTWNGFSDLLRELLSGSGHLWYLYAIMTLYLFTPIFSVFCEHASRATYRYALLLTFLLGSVITIALRTDRFPLLETIIEQMKVAYTLGFVLLYLMGDYLRRYPPQQCKEYLGYFFIGLAGSISTVLWTLALPAERAVVLSLSFFAPGNIAAGTACFVVIKALWAWHPVRKKAIRKAIRLIGSCTTGIYLSHILMLKLVNLWLWPSLCLLPLWAALPLRAASAFLLSLALTYILKHIPVLRILV